MTDRPFEVHALSASPSLAGVRVLLVEDHADTRVLMSRLLTRVGCVVEQADTARAAHDAGRRGAFDVLICDMRLPDGSGLDVMRDLRVAAAARGPVPAGIALTGDGSPDDVRRSRQAGFAAHLTKPIDFKRVESLVARLTGREC